MATTQLHRHRKSVKSAKISGSFRYIEHMLVNGLIGKLPRNLCAL